MMHGFGFGFPLYHGRAGGDYLHRLAGGDSEVSETEIYRLAAKHK